MSLLKYIVYKQLSKLPLSILLTITTAIPVISNCVVKGLHFAAGTIVSSTVTTAIQVFMFPLASTAVKVTLFAPKFAQVKSYTSRYMVSIAQLSLDPLLMSVASIETFPFVSK